MYVYQVYFEVMKKHCNPVEHLIGFKMNACMYQYYMQGLRYANTGFLGLFRKTPICACLTCIIFVILTSDLHNPVDHSTSFKMNVSMYQDYEYVPSFANSGIKG